MFLVAIVSGDLLLCLWIIIVIDAVAVNLNTAITFISLLYEHVFITLWSLKLITGCFFSILGQLYTPPATTLSFSLLSLYWKK